MSEQLPTVVPDADELQERFLAELRARVGWQAAVAAERRAVERAQPPSRDLRDPHVLARLVDEHADNPRAAEWRALIAELEPIVESDGRLPAMLDRLVSVVFADVL